MITVSGSCWKCGAKLESSDFGRQETCPKCGFDTRVCKNCLHYDPKYNNSCKENQADFLSEKEKSNFCDYFSPTHPNAEGSTSRDAMKSAAEALFKKK